MRRNSLALYLHLVWGTWDRQPLISPRVERALYRRIEQEARGMGCDVLALGGTEDHVHLVVEYPATATVASLVKQIKGASSHFVNDMLQADTPQFRWQGSYGAFTVSREALPRLMRYVRGQKEHHAADELVHEWEQRGDAGDSDAHSSPPGRPGHSAPPT